MKRIELDIRLGTRDDLADGKKIRVGQMYFLKSMITEKFEGPYYLYPLMSKDQLNDLKEYLEHDMLYVLARHWEQKIKQLK